jgi:two-component system chemotaxis response regulator CheB
VTTDALLRGAFDFILKPSSKDHAANRADLESALAEKVAAIRDNAETSPAQVTIERCPTEKPRALANCQAVVIGCSTGGPDALAQVIPYLSPDFPLPIVIVQHMPETFTASLAARLKEASEIDVQEAYDGLKLQKGMAVIARGGRHLFLERRGPAQVVCRLTEDPHEHSCRPAVDYTLRSAVEVFKGPILAVILTGMGKDGTDGCRLVREQGGVVVAQDADGCVVFGMPKSVINAGLADKVVPIVKIPSTIESIVRKSDSKSVDP